MSTEIGRRQFLIASSAVLATAAIGPKMFAGEAGGPPPKRLTVGFAPIDEAATVFAAASIPAGDGGFVSRGARVSVSGTSGRFAAPGARRAVELVAHYSYLDGAERRAAPFRAWGCSRMTGCQGSPASFTVPVDEIGKLEFTVETERGAPVAPGASRRDAISAAMPESASLPVTLSLLSEDSLKLARGFYVIVPLFDEDREPAWSQYELRASDGRWALTNHEGRAVSFEHFVLRIDYATS